MIRIFPRKTNASPDDAEVYFKEPEIAWGGNGERVDVSCTFTYDKKKAEHLAERWSAAGYEVECGGPAYDSPGGEFEPGKYLKIGDVITSRGCDNHCWFCCVPKREGKIRELGIHDGWNVRDDNLLQCSDSHIRRVFAMLALQDRKARFTGGLEAARLKGWHIDLLVALKPERMYFAYDTPDDYDPLFVASHKLRQAGFGRSKISCYTLIGYPKDTIEEAEKRLWSVAKLGIMPFAMLWRDGSGVTDKSWRQFQRHWAAPVAVGAKMKQVGF